MLQNGKLEKRTKIWKTELMRQMLVEIKPTIETEVDILKT